MSVFSMLWWISVATMWNEKVDQVEAAVAEHSREWAGPGHQLRQKPIDDSAGTVDSGNLRLHCLVSAAASPRAFENIFSLSIIISHEFQLEKNNFN